MTISSNTLKPANWLWLALAYNLVLMVLAVAQALQAPWLGLRLQADARGQIRVESAQGPAAAVPVGASLRGLSVEPGGIELVLQADDLMEEPDVVADYAQMDAFFTRQGQIAAVLAQPAVRLHWQGADTAAPAEAVVVPERRPLRSLPLLFWFQLLVSVAGCLIAAWVWVLRPGDWGVRMFGITGLVFPVFAMSAAVYSSRELALQASTFFALSAINHWGAAMFGAALVGIFLCHPRPLLTPRQLAWPFAVFNLWWLADVTRLAPDLDWGNRFLVMAEMVLAVVLAAVQWRRAKGQPVDRASLRWLFLSLLLGSGLFILSTIATVSLGWLPPLPQGYAFGFFLLIYVGIALGLRRYRLFDLDEWAYRMLLWVGGAVLVVGLDALLILALDWTGGLALGVSIWLVGMLYLPLRHWIWQRLVNRPRPQLHEHLPDVVGIAFQQAQGERERAWDRLLHRLYAPLELVEPMQSPPNTEWAEDGLALRIAACGGMAPRLLRYPDQGRRLFSPRDVAFVDALCGLMHQAHISRDAQLDAVLEERKRIARDVHDDVGARLLMLIHRAPTAELAELARGAMNDLRTALSTLDAQPVLLADALADWRAEVGNRCEAAGVRLQWQSPSHDPSGYLSARHKALFERALRESVTNALKHARPGWIRVRIEQVNAALLLTVGNDGVQTVPQSWTEGRGLRGMRQRLHEVGSELQVSALPGGWVELSLRMPMHEESVP